VRPVRLAEDLSRFDVLETAIIAAGGGLHEMGICDQCRQTRTIDDLLSEVAIRTRVLNDQLGAAVTRSQPDTGPMPLAA
jgi:hypothetical protein